MSRVLDLRPAARVEFDDAADWYFEQDPPLRDRFVAAVMKTMKSVVKSPFSFPVVSGTKIRRAIVRDFPYSIYFWFDDSAVTVISVFHMSRNPRIWTGRIE